MGNTIATVRYHLWIRPEEHGLIRSSGIVDVITGELMLVADVPLILHLEAGQSIWFVARARSSAIGREQREQYDITLISDLSGIT